MLRMIRALILLFLFVAYHAGKAQLVPAAPFSLSKVSEVLPPSALPDYRQLSFYKDLFKPGFHFNGMGVQTTMVYNRGILTSDVYTTTSLLQYNIVTDLQAEAMGIPMKVRYVRKESMPRFINEGVKDLYSCSIDVERYKEKFKKLAEQLGPEVLTQSGKQVRELKSAFKDQLLSKGRGSVKNTLVHSFDSLSQSLDPVDLAGKRPEELEQLFFGQKLSIARQYTQKKLEDIKAATLEKAEKDSLINVWQEKAEVLEGKISYIRSVYQLVQLMEKSGYLTTLKDLDQKALEEYNTLLQKPDLLIPKVAETFHLGGIGKVLALFSQVKAGGQELPFSPGGSTPFLGKGISLELNLGDKFIGFSAGRVIPIDTRLAVMNRSMLVDSSQDSKTSFWSLHYRKGLLSANHKGIMLTSVPGMGSIDNQLQPTGFRRTNTFMVSLYSKENLFADHWLSVDVSKSMRTGGLPKADPFNLNNASLKILVEGKIASAGVTHQVYFNKLIGAYTNTLSYGMNLDGYETGFSFQMRPMKSRISSYLRGVYRNFNMPGAGVSNWNTFDFKSRWGYKLKKGQSLQVSGLWHDGFKYYFFNTMQRVVRQQSKGISVDANLVLKRLFGLYNTCFISTGVQQDHFPIQGMSTNNSTISTAYTILLNHNLLMGHHLLQWNLNYMRVTQDINDLLYNTRLDIDGGGQFTIGKDVSTGVSLVYGYLKGGYSNFGVKSSLSSSFKRFTISINSDIRKNIRVENPLFDHFFNVNCDIKYTIK